MPNGGETTQAGAPQPATKPNAPVPDKKFVLTERIDETPEVEIVRFKSPDGHRLDFESGMFVMIYGMDKATGKPALSRAFSIASSPRSEVLELFVVKVHEGHTTYFLQSKPGDEYFIKGGPNGQFKLDIKANPKVVFIAGGTGLAPFMSMLRFIDENKLKFDIKLFYSVKYPTEIIRKQELEDLKAKLNVGMYVTVTRPQPGDGWTGDTGHVSQQMLTKYAPDIKDRAIYICGPLAFVKAMKDALTALGIAPANVKADVWG